MTTKRFQRGALSATLGSLILAVASCSNPAGPGNPTPPAATLQLKSVVYYRTQIKTPEALLHHPGLHGTSDCLVQVRAVTSSATADRDIVARQTGKSQDEIEQGLDPAAPRWFICDRLNDFLEAPAGSYTSFADDSVRYDPTRAGANYTYLVGDDIWVCGSKLTVFAPNDNMGGGAMLARFGLKASTNEWGCSVVQ